ncbi:kinase domain protein [Gracilaria domingensis]|nr:kinase domain protein [Gracilaria domingensis]
MTSVVLRVTRTRGASHGKQSAGATTVGTSIYRVVYAWLEDTEAIVQAVERNLERKRSVTCTTMETTYNGSGVQTAAPRDERRRRGARKRAQIVCIAIIAPNRSAQRAQKGWLTAAKRTERAHVHAGVQRAGRQDRRDQLDAAARGGVQLAGRGGGAAVVRHRARRRRRARDRRLPRLPGRGGADVRVRQREQVGAQGAGGDARRARRLRRRGARRADARDGGDGARAAQLSGGAESAGAALAALRRAHGRRGARVQRR